MNKSLLTLLSLILFNLSGCTNMTTEQYKNTTPRLILEDYFLGQTRAWGIFQNRSGYVEKQFTVDILGKMVDGVQTIKNSLQITPKLEVDAES
jgi:hypothetical protein